MAALMFAAMVLLLTPELKLVEPRGDDIKSDGIPKVNEPLVYMLGSFFSLVVASFLFAVTAGDSDRANDRQFVEAGVASMALSIGVAQMAGSLAWLLERRNQRGAATVLAGALVHATVGIAAVLFAGVWVAPLFERSESQGVGYLAWFVLAALVSASVPIGVRTRRATQGSRHEPIVRRLNVAALLLALTAAVLWGLVSALGDPSWLYAFPGGSLIAAFVFVVAVWFVGLEASMPPG
jgi:hypothetical protein